MKPRVRSRSLTLSSVLLFGARRALVNRIILNGALEERNKTTSGSDMACEEQQVREGRLQWLVLKGLA